MDVFGIKLEDGGKKRSTRKDPAKDYSASENNNILEDIPFKSPTPSLCDVGWHNLAVIIVLLFLSSHIIHGIAKSTFNLKYLSLGIDTHDHCWFGIHLLLNLVRYASFYFLKLNSFWLGSFLLLTESLLWITALPEIKHSYLRGWSSILSIIVFLKLTSYGLEKGSATFREFWEFLCFPTFIYKRHYERRANCRLGVCILRIVEFGVYFILFSFTVEHHTYPYLQMVCASNSSIEKLQYAMYLSISTTTLFILFFLLVFRCCLGCIAELTKFNESICGSWWNSQSLSDFWSSWNLPVHQFILAYIYKPLRARGMNRLLVRAICFLASGIIHEAVASFIFRRVYGTVFFAMTMQIPLIYLTDWIKRTFPRLGNFFFWVFLCTIGQPLIAFCIFRNIAI